MITSTELEKLKSSLPNDHLTILNKRTGFSKTYIYQVLNGERSNIAIIDAAIDLAEETKRHNIKRINKIQNL
jgi:hypothetical protein